MIATGLLLFTTVAVSVSQTPIAPGIYLTQNQGFCSPGVVQEYTKPAWEQPPGLKLWGSFCEKRDRDTGVAETSTFPAPQRFAIYLAGYLSQTGLSLEIENLNKRSKLAITPSFISAEQWYRFEVRLPDTWRDDPVRLVARDNTTEQKGWLAFSEPIPSTGAIIGFAEGGQLFLRTLLYFTLTLMPCLAFGAFAIRKGFDDELMAGLLQLAGLGACGYLSFWIWLAGPKPGHLFSLLLPILSAAWFAREYLRLDAEGRRTIKQLLTPLALVGASSLLIVSDGFLYGALETPFYAAAKRFSHVLPPDNRIPYLFAEGVRDHHVPRPLISDYLSSDRPPLQTGLVLSQYPYLNRPRELGYTVHGVIVQSLWIFGAWLLLTAFGLDRRAVTLALAVCLFSGFVFLNSFYVWPKLLAAAYILSALAILITPKAALLKNSKTLCIVTGALIALSMLSHGGSAFAFIGAALTAPVLRIRIPLKSLLLVVVAAGLMYLPWTLYQRFYDPPGNRLTKMHLAGVGIYHADPRPFGKTLIGAYKALTPPQIIANKTANVQKMFESSVRFWIELTHLVTHIREPDSRAWISAAIRGWMYHGFVICLGFLAIGPFALLIGIFRQRRTREWRAAGLLWVFTALTLAVWCLLMFGPGTTIIHQGTYATVLLGYVASILALWALSPRLAVAIGCCQVLLNVLLYVVLLYPPAAGGLLAEPPPLLTCALLAAASLVCVVWLFVKLSRADAPAETLPRMRQEFAVALSPGDRAVH